MHHTIVKSVDIVQEQNDNISTQLKGRLIQKWKQNIGLPFTENITFMCLPEGNWVIFCSQRTLDTC